MPEGPRSTSISQLRMVPAEEGSMSLTCLDCPKQITFQSKTGRCRACSLRHSLSNPEVEARRKASSKKTCSDPRVRAKIGAGISRARRKRIAEDPAFAERMRETCRQLGKSGMGAASAPPGSESRKRTAAKLSARYLSWCPEQYREEYRLLRRRMATAKAKAAILAKVTPFEWQMHRVSRGAGIVIAQPMRRHEPDYTLGGVTAW